MSKYALFLIGEAEYASQNSMPALIEEFRKTYGWKTTVCTSNPIEDGKDFYEFTGFDSTDGVDVLVIFTRFRNLSKRQMELILQYIEKGRPVAALRTSTHSFMFPEDSEYFRWNIDFGTMLFGTPWRYHHGHSSCTDVYIPDETKDSCILQGVSPHFHARSWLYHVLPLPDSCVPLLMGRAVGSELTNKDEICENPVAWTNMVNGGRVFYTSLGHPEDFELISFRRLVMNGIRWAAGTIND